jgi:hypothetical protein
LGEKKNLGEKKKSFGRKNKKFLGEKKKNFGRKKIADKKIIC